MFQTPQERKIVKFNNIKQHKKSKSASLFVISNDVDANTDEINKASICVELYHNSTLIHDDIMDEDIDRRTARTIWQLGEGVEVTEKNRDIVKLANIMSDYSEVVRKKLNNLGANIGKLSGWIVRQTHDPFQIRNAAKVLKELSGKESDDLDGTLDRNLKAWKEYITPKLKDETFSGFDNKDEFLKKLPKLAKESSKETAAYFAKLKKKPPKQLGGFLLPLYFAYDTIIKTES